MGFGFRLPGLGGLRVWGLGSKGFLLQGCEVQVSGKRSLALHGGFL